MILLGTSYIIFFFLEKKKGKEVIAMTLTYGASVETAARMFLQKINISQTFSFTTYCPVAFI